MDDAKESLGKKQRMLDGVRSSDENQHILVNNGNRERVIDDV